MSLRSIAPALIALAVVGGGLAAFWFWSEARQDELVAEARAEREAREEREQERLERATARLREESAGLVPPMLEGVALGQSESEVRSARPEAVTRRVRTPPGEFWLEERLGNGAQALFAFGAEERVLQQVQVLSRIDPRGVGPHLTAMNEQYGRPTGVWRCSAQSAAGVPTLRFTWRKSHVSVQDIFLVHPGGVSITLYVAPTETIRQSLTIGGCRPVRSREDLDDLPFATPEMLQGREVQ